MDDQDGSERVYMRQGKDFILLNDCQKAIEYYVKDWKIAREIADKKREGCAYENLGNAYASLADYQKAIEYHEKTFENYNRNR